MNAKTLVDEIKLCLREGADGKQVANLGGQYLTLYSSAVKRLQRCIDLIRQGKESTALQEAQFSPPLMDLIEALSFPQFDKWGRELEKNGLSAPSSFDSKHISMMGELFSRPIEGTDPLYSDLAHAMRTKDKESALTILRIIHQKNPSDKNAEEQLDQVEETIQAKKMDELLAFTRARNKDSFNKAMSAFLSEPWKNMPRGGAWSEVSQYDERLKKEAKLAQCKEMIASLWSQKKKNSLGQAMDLLARIDSTVRENSLSLDDKFEGDPKNTYATTVETVRKWTEVENKKKKKQAEDKSREDNLKVVVRTIQDKEIGRKRKTAELRQDLARLTSAGRDLEQEGQSLADDDLKNFNRSLIKLREQIAQRQKSLRVMIASGCVAAVSVIGVSFYLISERLKWNDQYETLMAGVKQNRNVENLESFLDSFEKNNPERISDVEFETEIKKNRSLIADARSFNDSLGQKIHNVLQYVKEANDLEAVTVLFGRKKLLWEELNRLNPAYLENRQEQLREVDLEWNQKRDRIQSEISKIFVGKLSSTSSFAEEKLGMEQDPAVLEANLGEFNKMLLDVENEADKYSQLEGLGLSSGQKDVLASMRKGYEEKKATLNSFKLVLEEIDQADSADSLFGVFDKIISSGLTGAPQYKPVQEVLKSRLLFTDIAQRKFMPDAQHMWIKAKDLMTSRYKPEQLLPKEREPIQALTNDEKTKEIYGSPFFSSESPERFVEKNEAWSPKEKEIELSRKWTKGTDFDISLTFQRAQFSGPGSYLLTQTADVVKGNSITEQSFESVWTGISNTFKVMEPAVTVRDQIILGGSMNEKNSVISRESEYLHGNSSALSKMFPAGEVTDSPLRYLDSLKRENIDPFIKAKIFLAVCEMMTFRPHEWGLKNNPAGKLSLDAARNKLINIVGTKDLVEEWYSYLSDGKETVLRENLINFFKTESDISYFKEARFYQKFWDQLLATKFEFKGYCSLDGSWDDSIPKHVWGLGKNGTLQVVRRNADETLPFSPILAMDKEFSTILSDASAHAGFEDFQDENYARIKKTLPYPFSFVREDE